MKSYYDILGVSPDATESEIRKAYRTLVKKYHPDMHKDDKIASEMIKEINVAYGVLSDHSKRLIYDYDNSFLHNKNKSKHDEDTQKKRENEQQRKYQEEQKRHEEEQTKREEERQRKYQEEQKKREEERQKREEQEKKYYEDLCMENVKKMQEEQQRQKKREKKVLTAIVVWFAIIALCIAIVIWQVLQASLPSTESDKTNSSKLTKTPRPTATLKPTHTPKIVPDLTDTFSLGSTTAKVRKVMGYPDKTIGSQWHYGNSTVTFENQRVNGFINNGELRVSLGDRIDGATFTNESMTDDVIKAMGTPDKVWDDVWYYGASTVTIEGGKVKEYVNSGELKLGGDSKPKPSATPKATKKATPTATPKPTVTPTPTVTPKPTATPSPTPTSKPVNDVYNMFTIGSTTDEVLKAMGTPDEVWNNQWSYGNSTISISNGTVKSYINRGELRVFLGNATEGATFTLGSTTQEVINAMGTPDEVWNSQWSYGNSTISISNGTVKSYINRGELRVFLGNAIEGVTFSLGSTTQEVINAMGTPDEVWNNQWKYGSSTISFSDEKVKNYVNRGELKLE